jgi:hypothetical protein
MFTRTDIPYLKHPYRTDVVDNSSGKCFYSRIQREDGYALDIYNHSQKSLPICAGKC